MQCCIAVAPAHTVRHDCWLSLLLLLLLLAQLLV
jgi:hypothetical protein